MGGPDPPLKRWHLCLGGQVTSCSATALVLHFAYTLLTLRCWSYTSLLVPRGPDRTTIGPASRTWYLAGPCPFTHGASPAMRVACWLCSARTDGADTHDPSRHAIELMHKPIPLCLRGARLTARDPLRLVVLAHHRLHTRRLQVLERLPRIMSLPLRTRPLDLPNVWRVHRRGGSRSEEAW